MSGRHGLPLAAARWVSSWIPSGPCGWIWKRGKMISRPKLSSPAAWQRMMDGCFFGCFMLVGYWMEEMEGCGVGWLKDGVIEDGAPSSAALFVRH